jgi:HPt (histidine-containing phosphotransfer) domain-containing protein
VDAAPAAAAVVLDAEVLNGLSGGDADEARALLGDFLASTEEDLAGIGEAQRTGDAAGIARHAHRLKGAARLVGAAELGEVAERLEGAGRAGDWAAVRADAASLRGAMERLRAAVAALPPG